jgi:hypothetical protein
MTRCITCGSELHPERALKYDYCMAPECQQKNARGLTMVAVGQNKAADELLILDERTREDLASGKYHDQRRGSYGPPAPGPTRSAAPPAATPPPAAAPSAAGTRHRARHTPGATSSARPGRAARRDPWTRSQERLALLYNEQGLRPAEIAEKLRLSGHVVTQIILAARNRGKS